MQILSKLTAAIAVKCWAHSLAQSDSHGSRPFVTVISTSESPCHTLSHRCVHHGHFHKLTAALRFIVPALQLLLFEKYLEFFCSSKILTPVQERISLHNTHTDVLKNFTFCDTNSLFSTFSRIQELVGQEMSGIWSWPAADHAGTVMGRLLVPCVFSVPVCCWSLGSLN